jgi:hypothetical protein
MSRLPPIDPGPFLQPNWTGNAPQTRLIQQQRLPVQGGGGVSIPSNSLLTASLDFVAKLNGSLVFPVTIESQLALSAPPTYRNLLYIRNSGAAVIFVEFGATASADSTARLEPNEQLMFDTRVPQDDIYVIGAAPSQVSISFSVIAAP